MNIFSLKTFTILLLLGLISFLSFAFFSNKRTIFLPGLTSNSHHLIESSCNSCHSPFSSIPDNNCNNCHKNQLQEDSHSQAKLLKAGLKKTNCIDCHHEHTGNLRPITSRQDFCFSCHQKVITEKESHKAFTSVSCGTSGCHNYHDNIALNLEVIKKQLAVDPSDLTFQVLSLDREASNTSLTANVPAGTEVNQELISEWQSSYHAQASINCMDCHEGANKNFLKNPLQNTCVKCHGAEFSGLEKSVHGIRGYLKLSPLVQKMSRLPMKLKDDEHRKLNCFICHDVHTVNTRQAAVESCLKCHNDQHSQQYLKSKHATLFAPEDTQRPGAQAVSCATCHMPRVEIVVEGKNKVVVDHNNSSNLRPRDKMLKVCLNCHDLEFSFNSIFDDEMIKNNFVGTPTKKHPTMKILVP